jgi:hypothetical protein
VLEAVPEGNKQEGRTRRSSDDNIEMDLKKIGFKGGAGFI